MPEITLLMWAIGGVGGLSLTSLLSQMFMWRTLGKIEGKIDK